MINYFVQLGIEPTLDIKLIEGCYKKQVFKWHPDRNSQSKESYEKFKLIQEAYEFLKKETNLVNCFNLFAVKVIPPEDMEMIYQSHPYGQIYKNFDIRMSKCEVNKWLKIIKTKTKANFKQ